MGTKMKQRVAAAVLTGGIAAGAALGVGTGTANAVEVHPGAKFGQTDLLLNGEETARAASGDVWAAFSYCSDIIAKYGATWGAIGGGAGTALAWASLGGTTVAGAGVGGVGGAGGAAVGCTGMVIDAAKTAKAQGKWAGLTFAPPAGGWTWTY
ncbi:hypothetical protein [Rhodococcus sp. UFZ-B548]|uniref:hypothetical protein n=1 Tax=Rhodococcus sp. UFZ-B548 TaxID=2742212 RepID=UPI0015F3548B|nr:hypothetical protein [Rhodococcus sp. UFZ-B548]